MRLLGSPGVSLKLRSPSTITLIRTVISSWGMGGTVMFCHWSIKLHATKAMGGVHAKLHTFLISPGDSSKAPDEPVVKTKCSVLIRALIPVV